MQSLNAEVWGNHVVVVRRKKPRRWWLELFLMRDPTDPKLQSISVREWSNQTGGQALNGNRVSCSYSRALWNALSGDRLVEL